MTTVTSSSSDIQSTAQISRLIFYVSLALSAVFITSFYNRLDLRHVDVSRRRRDDWHRVSIARTLVDIITERVDAFESPPTADSESRATAVRRAAERLLATDPDERSLDGLRYLASVLGHYRDQITSQRRSGNASIIAEPPEIDAIHMGEVVQSVGRMADEAEKRRLAEVNNNTSTEAQHPVSLSLHNGNGIQSAWQRFQNGITSRHLYDVNESNVGELMADMSSGVIVSLVQPPAHWNGSQHKLIFELQDGGRIIFRPDRWRATDDDVSPDVFYFIDKERPLSDLAAFHLDRVLEFHRSPPVVFARINITADIEMTVDETNGDFEFVRSPLGNECYSASCRYYCGTMEPICGVGRLLDGSFAALLPTATDYGDVAEMIELENPWRRTYSLVHHFAIWQDPDTADGYCDKVRELKPFDSPSKLLDLIDLHVFDFLIGNMDRHHLYYYNLFSNQSASFIHMDNAKGFGKARTDERSILAPLYQCCQIRSSTVKKLLQLVTSPPGKRLSDRLRQSLATQPGNPRLGEVHLRALDRRVGIVLDQVARCQQQQLPSQQTVVDDGL